jgi:hypothetical protein
MKLRGIDKELVEDIFLRADAYLEDTQTNTLVAVKRAAITGKEKDIALIYRKIDDEVLLITIHPLREGQVESRIRNGRWKKYERS